jgi:hypothetical protein
MVVDHHQESVDVVPSSPSSSEATYMDDSLVSSSDWSSCSMPNSPTKSFSTLLSTTQDEPSSRRYPRSFAFLETSLPSKSEGHAEPENAQLCNASGSTGHQSLHVRSTKSAAVHIVSSASNPSLYLDLSPTLDNEAKGTFPPLIPALNRAIEGRAMRTQTCHGPRNNVSTVDNALLEAFDPCRAEPGQRADAMNARIQELTAQVCSPARESQHAAQSIRHVDLEPGQLPNRSPVSAKQPGESCAKCWRKRRDPDQRTAPSLARKSTLSYDEKRRCDEVGGISLRRLLRIMGRTSRVMRKASWAGSNSRTASDQPSVSSSPPGSLYSLPPSAGTSEPGAECGREPRRKVMCCGGHGPR